MKSPKQGPQLSSGFRSPARRGGLGQAPKYGTSRETEKVKVQAIIRIDLDLQNGQNNGPCTAYTLYFGILGNCFGFYLKIQAGTGSLDSVAPVENKAQDSGQDPWPKRTATRKPLRVADEPRKALRCYICDIGCRDATDCRASP